MEAPERNAVARATRWERHFLGSGWWRKYTEKPAFSAYLHSNAAEFSAVGTAWRRELDSNSRYHFEPRSKGPCISDVSGFSTVRECTGETM
jgi:hypothetical protein